MKPPLMAFAESMANQPCVCVKIGKMQALQVLADITPWEQDAGHGSTSNSAAACQGRQLTTYKSREEAQDLYPKPGFQKWWPCLIPGLFWPDSPALKVLLSCCSQKRELWFILQWVMPAQPAACIQTLGFLFAQKKCGQNKAGISWVMGFWTLLDTYVRQSKPEPDWPQLFRPGEVCCHGNGLKQTMKLVLGAGDPHTFPEREERNTEGIHYHWVGFPRFVWKRYF
jgi:hypothetical protein